MEKLRSIFNFIYGYYLDYRYKVPPASALSFAYYMILSIIPICTLLAFFTPFFPLDLKTAQEILSYYLRPDVTKMVIQLIKPRSLSITTITTLIASKSSGNEISGIFLVLAISSFFSSPGFFAVT